MDGSTLFLAQLLGPTLLLLALAMAVRSKEFSTALCDLAKNHSALLGSGVCSFVVGLAITLVHIDSWRTDITGLITLLGWAMMARGIFTVLFPNACEKVTCSVAKCTYGRPAILAIIGAYLSYAAYGAL